MIDDPAFSEIVALRQRLARLEATAAEYATGEHAMTEAHIATRESRRRRDLAATFHRNPDYEHILALVGTAAAGNLVARDELAALMTPDTRMSLGFYETARASAMAEGLIDSKGEPR